MSEGKRRAAARPVAASRAADGRFVAKAPAGVRSDAGGEVVATQAVTGRAKARAIKRSTKRKRAPSRPPVRWSVEREQLFLETLGQTCNICEAVRASGLSSGSVYRRRRTSNAFCAAWVAALGEGYVRLEADLLDQALNGVREDKGDGRRALSPAVALNLLRHHRAIATGQAGPIQLSESEAAKALMAKLSEMNRRMGGAG